MFKVSVEIVKTRSMSSKPSNLQSVSVVTSLSPFKDSASSSSDSSFRSVFNRFSKSPEPESSVTQPFYSETMSQLPVTLSLESNMTVINFYIDSIFGSN